MVKADSTRDRDVEALLSTILFILERAPRQGGNTDKPEGSRWIMFSDTLANSLADRIREQLNPIKERAVSA